MSMHSAPWITAMICTIMSGGWMTAPGLAETSPSAQRSRTIPYAQPQPTTVLQESFTKVASNAIAAPANADQLQHWLDICATAAPEVALDACQRATALDPNFAIAWDNLGAVLEHLGRYEEAIEALARAIDLTPEDANIWYNLGVVLAKLQQYEESVAAFDEAYRLNPDDHQARKFADLLRDQF